MEHLISLSVGTKGADDHAQTHQDLSELARNLGVTHNYVSVSSSVSSSVFGEVDEDETEDAGCTLEHLHHDEDTLAKVRSALRRVRVETGLIDDEEASNIITELQNAGILFRERTPSEV